MHAGPVSDLGDAFSDLLSSALKYHRTEHFFHIMQLLSRDISGFLIALSIYKETVRIFDSVNDCEETKCPSLPLADFEGRTTRHHLEARFGPLGSVNCQ